VLVAFATCAAAAEKANADLAAIRELVEFAIDG